MLYELIAVVSWGFLLFSMGIDADVKGNIQVRPGNLLEVKEIARTAGSLILNSGGVIRDITNWGPFLLPKRTRKHQSVYHSGHYFIMRFDSSAQTQDTVRKTLGLDPRMIRFSVVRLGRTLEEIAKVGGGVEWRRGLKEYREAMGIH